MGLVAAPPRQVFRGKIIRSFRVPCFEFWVADFERCIRAHPSNPWSNFLWPFVGIKFAVIRALRG
jgi:hypothetical protein